mgnify:CR=1 FL=1
MSTAVSIVRTLLGLLFDHTIGNIVRMVPIIRLPKLERGPVSRGFLALLLGILFFGLTMLFSASYSSAYATSGKLYSIIKPQVMIALVGLAFMWILSNINYRALRLMSESLYIITVVLLILTLLSPEDTNGTYRWVYLPGGASFQPSELAKFSLMLWTADMLDRDYDKKNRLWYGAIKPALPLLLILYLLHKESHNSGMILLCLIFATMLVCTLSPGRWLLLLIPAGVVVGAYFLKGLAGGEGYAAGRMDSTWGLAPLDTAGMLWQTRQSIYAISTGGMFGVGIGASVQKHQWLPYAENDFIFGVIGEELGFFGCVILIGAFAVLLIMGVMIALRAPDLYGTVLGIGIISQIAWQVFLHIAVGTALIPNTGISLPFFSSGARGTAGTAYILFSWRSIMRVLIAAGGTAGHINPALAIAGALKAADPTAEIHFAGRREGMEYGLVTKAGYPFHHIEINGFQRHLSLENIGRNIVAIWHLALSGPRTRKILNEVKPDLVIGCGGYVSGPIVRAAARRGIKTAIHEQNAFPGVTNKLLAKEVNIVLAASADAVEKLGAPEKTTVVGNPVRPEVLTADRAAARAKLNAGNRTVILSFGGSLGADRINQVVADLCAWEKQTHRNVLHLHATGSRGVKLFEGLEKEKGFAPGENLVVTEYINNMPQLLAAADLVIARSGALTLAELEAVGRASVLIPSPNVAENHQYYNALELQKAGAAVVIEEKNLTGDGLVKTVETLLTTPGKLAEMGANAKTLGNPHSLDLITEKLLKLVNG